MDINNEDDDIKEIYAKFGLSYYLTNVLEHNIANALLFIEKSSMIHQVESQENWDKIIDSHLERCFSETLGKLKRRVLEYQNTVPSLASIANDLDACLKERNFIAHHFWRDYSEDFFSASGRVSCPLILIPDCS